MCVLYNAGDCPNANCVSYTYVYSDSYINADCYGHCNSDGDSNCYLYANAYSDGYSYGNSYSNLHAHPDTGGGCD